MREGLCGVPWGGMGLEAQSEEYTAATYSTFDRVGWDGYIGVKAKAGRGWVRRGEGTRGLARPHKATTYLTHLPYLQ